MKRNFDEVKRSNESRANIKNETRDDKKISKRSSPSYSSKKFLSDDKVLWGTSNEETEGKTDDAEEKKYKPNFGLTGALAKDELTGNNIGGVVLKHSIPLDSAKPTRLWRLYIFKDENIMETIHLHRQSSFLAGRDKRVVDIILEHPSCSSQHAVIQFRKVKVQPLNDEDDEIEVVKPFLMDLSSTHKTMLNGKHIEDCRYYELREKDCIRFGGSSREYVLLHAHSNEEDK
mmetsp:Transcript_1436/g.1971  ORF Transcript_1436/g.1971 Transcript_1436/m.1971 type:complete len:231 (+) Transcript_1436:2-694(+)